MIACWVSLCLPLALPLSRKIRTRNTKWIMLWTHGIRANAWSTSFTGRDGQPQIALGSHWEIWTMLLMWFPHSMHSIPMCHDTFRESPPSISCSCSAMSGRHPWLLCSCRLIAWKLIFRRGAVLHMLCPPWYSSFFSSFYPFSCPSC